MAKPFPPSVRTEIEDFRLAVEQGKRLAGLDLGTKTIGVALTDVEWRIATSAFTIQRKKFRQDVEALKDFCEQQGVGGLVLGLPLNMDGSAGPRAQSAHQFARNLAGILPLPLTFWDERLSTVAAERAMIDADMSRSKRAAKIDAAAAAFILQGALDRLSRS